MSFMADNPLSYAADIRDEPTDGRRSNFKQGWTRAVNDQEYESALDELTWNNLGWRLGQLFGETPDELRDEMFEWCVIQKQE
jgi:hypothetical protein